MGNWPLGALWAFHHLHLQRNVRQICIIISKKGSKKKPDSFFPMNIVKTISYNVYNRKKWLLYKHLMYHFNCSKTLSILISRVGVAFIQWCSPGMRFASSRKTCNCGSTLFLHSKATYISSSHKSIYAYVCYIYVCIYVHIYIYMVYIDDVSNSALVRFATSSMQSKNLPNSSGQLTIFKLNVTIFLWEVFPPTYQTSRKSVYIL